MSQSLQIIEDPNLSRNNSVVARSVWHVAPSCWYQMLLKLTFSSFGHKKLFPLTGTVLPVSFREKYGPMMTSTQKPHQTINLWIFFALESKDDFSLIIIVFKFLFLRVSCLAEIVNIIEYSEKESRSWHIKHGRNDTFIPFYPYWNTLYNINYFLNSLAALLL